MDAELEVNAFANQDLIEVKYEREQDYNKGYSGGIRR